LGFGLELETCAATGAREDLIYVSPKSGRAVSRAAGEPYREKLLVLPPFLCSKSGAAVTPHDVAAGFTMTEYFLTEHVLAPRNLPMPDVRTRMLGLLRATA
jgi:DNA repair protein RecO (recombination protein O)